MKLSRKDFLKKSGLFALAGAFGLTKLGTMAPVQAAVSDNTTVRNATHDQIKTDIVDATTDKFKSGQSTADLAKAVNELARELKTLEENSDMNFIKKTELIFEADADNNLTITKTY